MVEISVKQYANDFMVSSPLSFVLTPHA